MTRPVAQWTLLPPYQFSRQVWTQSGRAAMYDSSIRMALTFCVFGTQGQLAGLLSNGPASQGMGPPGMGPQSMLPPQHAPPLVHPQDWMGQPPMNGLMSAPQPGPPHSNMHDSRFVTRPLLVDMHTHAGPFRVYSILVQRFA